MILTFITFAVIQGIDGAKSSEHYCAINKAHTMCLYRTFNSMGLRCRYFHAMPKKGVKTIMLSKHNSFRNNYASHPNWQFSVPNMLALEWDEELTEIAARWAMQCPYYEDDFRDVDRFKVANMVAIGSHYSSFPTLLEVWNSIMHGNITFHKLPEGSEDGHQNKLQCAFKLDRPLTLITNPYFRYVGCAAAIYRQFEIEDEFFRTILVCNYGPLEDYYDKYQPAGPPCTRCPDDTFCHSNSSYPNLCTETPSSLLPRKLAAPRLKPEDDFYDGDEYPEAPSEQSQLDADSYRSNYSDPINPLHMETNKTNHYCDIMCNSGALHTMCKYQDNSKDFEEVVSLLGKPSKEYILTMHNSIRDDLAGSNPLMNAGPKFPLAANMREMIWNEELEKIAHRWVMQCKIGEDECRDIYTEGNPLPVYVSQLNYALNWTEMDSFPSIADAFYTWMEGMPSLTVDEVAVYKEPAENSEDYGPYAQIIWAETFMIGCAMSLCRSQNESRVIAACNYAPGGKIPGKSVFEFGGPCSSCPKLYYKGIRGSFCSEEYKSLCAVRIAGRSQFTDSGLNAVHKLELRQFDNDYSSKDEEDISRKMYSRSRNDSSCKQKCFNVDAVHTLCKYKGPSVSCKTLLIHNDAIETVLNLHNKLRDAVASGLLEQRKVKKIFPSASNMREMIWNKDIAESALRWASQCQVGNDQCRDLKLDRHNRKKYALNKHEVPSDDLMRVCQMYSWTEWDVKKKQPSVDELFNKWADEVVNFNIADIRKYKEYSSSSYHHFAQLIWARTFMVGCAVVSWESEKPGFRNLMMVCNYAPRGKQDSLPIYEIGGGCTGCQPLYRTGTKGQVCSLHLPSLCETSNSTIPALPRIYVKPLLLRFIIIFELIKSLFPNYHRN